MFPLPKIRGRTLAAYFTAVVSMIVLAAPIVAMANPGGKKQPPSDDTMAQYVLRHFASLPDYEPGDLISRTEVERVLEGLRRLGWSGAASKSILARVPADDDFVVKQLATEPGRKFMRKISAYPNAYDHLYRLAGLANGQRIVHELIRDKGGNELIEYLSTSQGGKNLGKMLTKTPQGADFNRPTGKIFTAAALLEEIRKSAGSD